MRCNIKVVGLPLPGAQRRGCGANDTVHNVRARRRTTDDARTGFVIGIATTQRIKLSENIIRTTAQCHAVTSWAAISQVEGYDRGTLSKPSPRQPRGE